MGKWAAVPSTTDRVGTAISIHHGARALFILQAGLGGLVGVLVGGSVFGLVSRVVDGWRSAYPRRI